MKYEWLDEFALSLPRAEKDFKKEWNAFRYTLNGKMFMMLANDNTGTRIANLKLAPQHGAALREKYKDIKPGYYMNKEHWNAVNMSGAVPDDLLKELIKESYELIFSSLPKKIQHDLSE